MITPLNALTSEMLQSERIRREAELVAIRKPIYEFNAFDHEVAIEHVPGATYYFYKIGNDVELEVYRYQNGLPF